MTACWRSITCSRQNRTGLIALGRVPYSRFHTHGTPWPMVAMAEEVRAALETGKPVVALESAIYTHGALGDVGLEEVVRLHGAVPAVCGVLAGVPTVGLRAEEIQRMVEEGAVKASRRDLAYMAGMQAINGNKRHGGTTIAGTMILARLAGIRVLGTGGLGGVHRGGHSSMDVSADLAELGRTRVAVVSSGAKGFLDIARTLEYLETQGAHVSTFADGGSGDVDFPAFWCRNSGFKSPLTIQDEAEAAAIIVAQERLQIESGLLFANPIPEKSAIPRCRMEAAIEQAVQEAEGKGISGCRNTPYILQRLRELTNGQSVLANKALVRSNVARAAKIAVELGKVSKAQTRARPQPRSMPRQDHLIVPDKAELRQQAASRCGKVDVMVVGSVALDLNCDLAAGARLGTSNPCSVSQSVGGVGRNVALAAHKILGDGRVRLCSLVGDDTAGRVVLASLRSCGLDHSSVRRVSHPARTAQYVAVNEPNKDLVVAVADMTILESHCSPSDWSAALQASRPSWVVIDGNWTAPHMRCWLTMAGRHKGAMSKVLFEPVSAAKSARLFAPASSLRPGSDQPPPNLGLFPTPHVHVATPNEHELVAMHAAARENGYLEANLPWFAVLDALNLPSSGSRARFAQALGGCENADLVDMGLPQQAVFLLPYIPTLAVKLGPRGVLLVQLVRRCDPLLNDPAALPYLVSRGGGTSAHMLDVGGLYMHLFPPPPLRDGVVGVNGAGDTFVGVLVAGLAMGGRAERLVDVAQEAAVATLASKESVADGVGLLGPDVRMVCAPSTTFSASFGNKARTQ